MLSCLVPRFGQEDMPSSTKFDLQCKDQHLHHLFLSLRALHNINPTKHFLSSELDSRKTQAKSLRNILGKVVVKKWP